MKRNLWVAMIAAMALGGCASAERVERTAQANEKRSQKFAAAGYTQKAAEKHELAVKQWDKARQREVWEDVMPVVFH